MTTNKVTTAKRIFLFHVFVFIQTLLLVVSLTQAKDTNSGNSYSKKIINRQLSASISSSSWPTTPTSPLCEAYSYLDSSPSNQDDSTLYYTWKRQYLSTLTNSALALANQQEETLDIASYEQGVQFALDNIMKSYPASNSNSYNSTMDSKIISFALATRAHAPQCEMFRALSQHAISKHTDRLYNHVDGTTINAFVVLNGTNQVFTSIQEIVSYFAQNLGKDTDGHDSNKIMYDNDDYDAWSTLLPNEMIFQPIPQEDNNHDDNIMKISSSYVLILYGQFHTIEFATLYQFLEKENYSFVVRYIGDVDYDEQQISRSDNDSSSTKTFLQGYGVRVDIRNLEYKSFDDKATGLESNDIYDDDNGDDKNNEHNAIHTPETLNMKDIKENWMTKGIDPNILKKYASNDEMQQFLQRYMPHLLNIEHYHLPIIPPRKDLESISLAATSIISQSEDPLWSLVQISQNLPSHAGALSNFTIPKSLIRAAEAQLYPILSVQQNLENGIFEFYVNGKRIYVERPSFNLFELINVLREESVFLDKIQLTLEGYVDSKEGIDISASLLSMGKNDFDRISQDESNSDDDSDNDSGIIAMMGIKDEKKFRVDVGRGYKGAVLYMNDIEKDAEYRSWPKEVDQIMMSIQFGGPPTIRRNMLTNLLVIDPFDSNIEGYLTSMSLLLQMLQGMYPIRIGLIFANKDDIKTCRNAGENEYCLNKQFQDTSRENLMKKRASSQAVSVLVQHVFNNYGGMAALSYLFQLMREIQEDSIISIEDLIGKHMQVMMMMMQEHMDELKINELFTDLKHSESNDSENASYEKAIRFAIQKNIQPGMAFMNGIPFPINDAEESQHVIMDEMNYLVGMIMTQKITNQSPRSIYAKLLTGDNVYKSMHPLLTESEPRYHIISSYFDDDTLIEVTSESKETNPYFFFEAIVDLTSREGLRLVESALTTFSSVKEKIKKGEMSNEMSIAFRVLPSDVTSAETLMGGILRYAQQFGIENLLLITRATIDSMGVKPAVNTIGDLASIGQDIQDMITVILRKHAVDSSSILWTSSQAGTISLNGRVFAPQDILQVEDIELLIDLEKSAANTISKKVFPYFSKTKNPFVVTARLTSFVGNTFANYSKIQRSDALAPYRDMIEHSKSSEDNWFYFAWNVNDGNEKQKPEVTVILDPLSDATQRAGPIIRTLRDDFKLPINLILVPRLKISEDSALPITSYYRFVAEPLYTLNDVSNRKASFQGLPVDQVLTIRMDVPEPWDIQQGHVTQDTDNLRCDAQSCSDAAYAAAIQKKDGISEVETKTQLYLTEVEYNLNSLLLFGQCYDASDKTPPNGLQFTLSEAIASQNEETMFADMQVLSDGTVGQKKTANSRTQDKIMSGTLVMKTVGYWQLQSSPGVWQLQIADGSRGSTIYELVQGKVIDGDIIVDSNTPAFPKRTLVMKDFVNRMEVVLVKRRPDFEETELLAAEEEVKNSEDDVVHVFSLATGHLYERFLKIMMLSVTKRSSSKVKFWLLENFLSPSFKSSAFAMAERIGCEVEFITYKWPEWLRGQSEKQRIIWGYKILFLDVLFPLDLQKVIYVDADQVVRGDLKELMDLDLEGAPYGYTPMCESNAETKGYQFWREGFWPNHLRGKPYHISALYVVDLQRFRRELVGDKLRAVYQQLTADPNNLSNLDQDLPNYTQHQIKIHSLPQDWLWCESWCSDDTKTTAKTIDLCNNPAHKEPKVSMAKRIISGHLFDESWVELDAEVEMIEKIYLDSLVADSS